MEPIPAKAGARQGCSITPAPIGLRHPCKLGNWLLAVTLAAMSPAALSAAAAPPLDGPGRRDAAS